MCVVSINIQININHSIKPYVFQRRQNRRLLFHVHVIHGKYQVVLRRQYVRQPQFDLVVHLGGAGVVGHLCVFVYGW
jgi:hypothetical protein